MAEEDGKLHFPLIRKKRKQNKKMLLMKTANAYLIMIHWLFQDNLSQKMREKKQMTYFYYHHYLCAFFSIILRHCCDFLLFIYFYYFFDWHWCMPGLLRFKPNPPLSAGNQPDTDLSGRLVRVKPGLTISTVSRGCESCQHAGTQMH